MWKGSMLPSFAPATPSSYALSMFPFSTLHAAAPSIRHGRMARPLSTLRRSIMKALRAPSHGTCSRASCSAPTTARPLFPPLRHLRKARPLLHLAVQHNKASQPPAHATCSPAPLLPLPCPFPLRCATAETRDPTTPCHALRPPRRHQPSPRHGRRHQRGESSGALTASCTLPGIGRGSAAATSWILEGPPPPGPVRLCGVAHSGFASPPPIWYLIAQSETRHQVPSPPPPRSAARHVCAEPPTQASPLPRHSCT